MIEEEFNTSNDTESADEIIKSKTKRKRIIIPIIMVIIIVTIGLYYYNQAITFVSTDDAYIEGHTIQLSPKVSGNIAKVCIEDNQKIKKGQLIAEIDPRDYQVIYNQAVAKLETSIARQKSADVSVGLTSITSGSLSGQSKAALEQTNHNIIAARAQMNFAQVDFDRYTKLYSKGVVSKQDFDKVSTNYKVVQEKLNQALKAQDQAIEKAKGLNTVEQQVAMSNAQLKAANAEIKQLKYAADQAKLNLSYTKIYAPKAGVITNRSVEEGAFVQAGQPLLTIVPEERWVIANFKETQLTNMKIGQPVLIKADAYPNKIFKGSIDSIQSSTGAKSSLFPPENAVGSFVKVVQRIPVKIIFTEKLDPQYAIVPGMSVIPEVKIK
ncbi:MAG: HlyD family secretion protein [Candidatus Gastranaerophilales bacterium]|nr:HlyD family secretion protein [Candidatus Gastranaerophilales bacterium]